MRFRGSPTLFLLAGTVLAGEARADEPLPVALDATSAPRFGDTLLAAGDPFNALTYYRLGLFLDPDRPDATALWFRVALCYERGERWDAAASAWLDLAGRDPIASPHATYRAAMSTLGAGRYAEAKLDLQEVAAEGQGTAWAERAAFLIPVADLLANDPASARLEFASFDAAHPGSPLIARSQAAVAVLEGHDWHRPPALAGAMSLILPGSGQLYAGHAGDGVMAFVANGTLATFTYSLMRQGIEQDRGWEVGMGTVLGGMTALSWTSNVIGAAQGAKRANVHHARRKAEAALREADAKDLEREAADVELPPISD
jgi:hypothetical protein